MGAVGFPLSLSACLFRVQIFPLSLFLSFLCLRVTRGGVSRTACLGYMYGRGMMRV